MYTDHQKSSFSAQWHENTKICKYNQSFGLLQSLSLTVSTMKPSFPQHL